MATVTTFLCMTLTSAGGGGDCHVVSSTRDLISTVLHNFAGDWRILGSELGVKRSKTLAIEHDERNTFMKQREVLHAWFDAQTTPCWEDVLTALRSPQMGLNHLAGKIEKCFKCGEDSIVTYCVRNDGKCMKNPTRDRSEL